MSNQSVGLAPRALAMVIDGALMIAASTLLMWAVYGDPVSKWSDLRPGTIAINWLLPLIVGAKAKHKPPQQVAISGDHIGTRHQSERWLTVE